MIRCLHCGAETDNGLALCAMCQHYATTILEYLPVYFRNMSRWRPGKAGSRRVPGSRGLWDGEVVGGGGDRVTRALDEVGNALGTWARTLADDRPHMADALTPDGADAEVVAALCETFGRHVTSIATTDWCGAWLTELANLEARLRRLTEQVAPGWYAGGCKTCEVGTYVIPGLTWVTCSSCGTTTHAADHVEVILSEARGWVARPKALAGVVVALVATEQSVERLDERIRYWSRVGWLQPVRHVDEDGDAVGPKRYRLGDVLDLALGAADAPTRPKRVAAM